MADKIIHLPISTTQDADEHARKDTERNQKLFEWADEVLKRLGLDKAVATAMSVEELGRVALDTDSAEITLAIRDALHPASGKPQDHFCGLSANGLKVILRNRLGELKKERRVALRRGKQPDWSDQLILDAEGKIIGNLANLILILRESPDWKGVLRYDEFSVRVVIKRRPPFEAALNTPWTDHHESQTRVWFLHQGIKAAIGDVGRAVQAAARHNAFNPVRDFFESLVWDGVPRLETWLHYLCVEDSEYARAIGPRYLISAVARVYEPGAKVDHMLVLEGPQGRLKSEALRTLAVRDEWFTDRLSHIATKDAALDVAGVLIVEIAEMDALTRATPSAMKAFITRRRDRFRPPYGKHVIDRPRQNVFAGSLNPPAGGYLKDPTGSRRLWPVACRGMIDRDGLEKVRDQLWAEAVHRYKAGAKWWLETPELEALATVEQEARFAVDSWEESIREWLGKRNDVGLSEVLEHALGLAPEQQTQAAQKRVGGILTRMRFVKRRPRTKSGGREHRYQRDPVKK